jgi:hypothetical protein
MYKITKREGLGDKMFEIAFQAGEAYSIETQIVLLRKYADQIKKECTHPADMQQIEHHEFTYHWGNRVTWTTSHCAFCNGITRSNDILHGANQ